MSRLFRVVRNLNRLPEVWNAYRKIENWYGLTLRFLGMNNLEYPYQVKTRDGLLLLVQDFCDATTVWTVWCKEEYKVSQDAKVIVDLGANIGAFSIYAAHKSPNAHVISLEPFPSTFKKLTDNILLNGLEKRITCLSYAISDKRNNRTMLSTEFGSATNRFLEVGDTEHQDTLEISCMKFEDVLDIIQEKVSTRRVDLLKMDIEGAEHEVVPSLKSSDLSYVQDLQFEYHPSGSKDKLFEKLVTSNFKCIEDDNHAENYGYARFVHR